MMSIDSKQCLAAAVAAAFVVAGIAAHAAEQGDRPNPEFTRLDVNHDRYLSREETANIEGFGQAFIEADDNGDGRLDAAEFIKAQAIHERLRAAQFVNDSLITAKVKAALLEDSLVKGLDVSVKTRKGVVLLSGFVASQRQAKRAAELAAAVSGVVSVKNGLVVAG